MCDWFDYIFGSGVWVKQRSRTMHKVEKELVTVSKFKQKEDDFENRQSYLLALLEFTNSNTSDDDFERISEDGYAWIKDAAKAVKAQKPIPEFKGGSIKATKPKAEAVKAEPVKTEAVKDRTPMIEKTSKPAKRKRESTKPSIEKDKFNFGLTTKRHQAAMLLEKTTTMQAVKEKLGMTFYNMLKELKIAGHTVTQDGLNLTLVHRDGD